MSIYGALDMDAETADHPSSLSFSTSAASRGKKVSRESEADSESEISGDLHPSLHNSSWDSSCLHGLFHKISTASTQNGTVFLEFLLQASSFSPDKNNKQSRTFDITN